MDAMIDVFLILGDGSFHWIGCARTDNEAINLMRTEGTSKGGRFFTLSQKTGGKTFYSIGREYDVIQIKQPPAGIGLSTD